MIVTIVPLAAGAIVARYLLKMSPLMTLGGLAGAQTCTPGLERAAGGERQQHRLAGLHRAVRDRQHPAHRVRDRSSSPSSHAMRTPDEEKRGFDVLRDKTLNRSIAFRRKERDRLGLSGTAAVWRGDAAADGAAGDDEPRAAAAGHRSIHAALGAAGEKRAAVLPDA